jgi:hypothetical protein
MDLIDIIDVDRLINNISKKMMPLNAFYSVLHSFHIAPQFCNIAKDLQRAMSKKDRMSKNIAQKIPNVLWPINQKWTKDKLLIFL